MSQKESEKQTQTAPFTGTQQNVLDTALNLYTPQLGSYQPYQGDRVAGMTGTQTQALGGAGDFLNQFSAYRDIPLYGEGGSALQGLLSGQTGAKPISPEISSQFFSEMYEQPARQRYAEFGRPAIKEAYSGPGYWSSARAGAEAKGARDLGDWLGGKQGEFMWNVEQSNRAIEEAKAGRALSAVGQLPGYATLPTTEARNRLSGRAGVFDFAGAEQNQRQAEINAAMQSFADEFRIADPGTMDMLMRLLGFEYSQTTQRKITDPSDFQSGVNWFNAGTGALAALP